MKEKNQILFERYFNGDLSPKEFSLFETRLKEDSNFKADFDLFKEMQEFLGDKIRFEEPKANIQDVHEDYIQTTKKTKSPKWLWLPLLILIGASIYFFFNREKGNTKKKLFNMLIYM